VRWHKGNWRSGARRAPPRRPFGTRLQVRGDDKPVKPGCVLWMPAYFNRGKARGGELTGCCVSPVGEVR
jgi:hypothetical protein